MTGFSQALETKRADEIGADGFLAKPFRESELADLLDAIRQRDAQQSPNDVDLDPMYCKVSVEYFMSEKKTECDIYIRVSKFKYIKIAHSGGKITDDRIKVYQEKGVRFVYIKKEEFRRIVDFNLQVAKVAISSTNISDQKKLNFLRHTGELVLENAFVNGIDKELFDEATNFIETTMDILTDDNRIKNILEALSHHADFLYCHSLAVSTFSVMIGRQLGWSAPGTLFKLSMGGLFHDVGKCLRAFGPPSRT